MQSRTNMFASSANIRSAIAGKQGSNNFGTSSK